VPVRVLDRQLGLAHPAQAVQRLHHRRAAGAQPFVHGRQRGVPADEGGVARADVPHRRQHPGQPRAGLAPAGRRPRRPPPGEQRSAVRAAGTTHRLHQPPHRLRLVHAEQLDSHQRPQQPRQRAPFDLHRHQPVGAVFVLDQRRRPLVRRVPAVLEIRGRQQRDHPVRRIDRSMHPGDEVLPGGPVPGVQLHRVPGLGQMPGDPLRPRPVPPRVADEEVHAGRARARPRRLTCDHRHSLSQLWCCWVKYHGW
jgi:hypothetical protein